MAAPANNPFGAPPTQVVNNPFGPPAPSSSALTAPTTNPFAAPPSPSVAQNPFARTLAQAKSNAPFGTPQGGPGSTQNPFGSQTQPASASKKSPVVGPADASAMARRVRFADGKPLVPNNNRKFGGGGGQAQGPQRTAASNPFAQKPHGSPTEANTRTQRGGRNKQPERQERYQPSRSRQGTQHEASAGQPTERTKQLSPFAFDYATKLYDQLRKENIKPPQWPAEPGNPNKRGAVESFKEAYKKFRARVYASLRKADLIDDPEKRRKLEDALPFKGICEDMCPEFEQVSRIAEYDVKTEEKETRPDGLTMWPDPSRMVKKFGRSAAGQDAPLPMDVRTVDALRRTTDYLFNDLLQSESNLPSMHNFLWDRTRAVRKDFTFHSQKTGEEMKEMVYCFEAITRFHATALHLLSRKGFANEDFDQKQEIEQLGRTILSLMEAYDVCRDKGVRCENEREFRAYYLLLNAHDPAIARRIPTWGKEYWFESEEVQTALSLIHAMEDVREPKGPIKPRRPTALSDTSFTNYFSIVEDPRVSYTMACVAEVHFTTVRQGILRNLVRAYARYRDAPRTITASDLNAMLRFDTPEEAVEFAELHDFEFSTWVPEGRAPVIEPYLLLNNKKKHVPSPRVRQSFSGKLVERKRTTQSLPYVIYNTIFEEPAAKPSSAEDPSDDLFVSQATASEELSSTPLQSAKPSIATAATSPSFGAAAQSTPFTNGIPSTGAPAGTPAPAFPSLQSSQPSIPTIPNPFAAQGQLQAQALAAKSPFMSMSQPQPPPTTGTPSEPTSLFGQPAKPGQATTSSLPALKPLPSGISSPFTFPSSTPTPSLSTTGQQTTSALPAAPSLFGSAASQPTTAHIPSQNTSSTQSAPSSSLFGSVPPPGAPPFSTTPPAKPAEKQPGSALAAVPSIFVSPPSATGQPTAQATQPTPFSAPSQLPGISPSSASTSKAAAISTSSRPQQHPKRDLIGDFTRWFVKGDDGIMEHFTEETLRIMLWDVWQDFEREEAERKRRAEDEESWRVAREHLNHRLRTKYFYKWRNNARSLATKRILREGKEKMRLYREQQQAFQKQLQAEKEKAEKEARKAAKRQLMDDTHRISLLAASARRRGSVAYSADHNPEEQLLASGVFSGLRDDPRSVTRRVVREAGDAWAVASAPRSFRYPESELELEPAPSNRGSPDASSAGGRREGWKTRSLRERFGIEPRRSLSPSGSVVNGASFRSSSTSRFRQSLPGNGTSKITNFSRKRSAEDDEGDEDHGANKKQSVYGDSSTKPNGLAKSRHWELRVRGFVPMPDGNWLPEAIAKSVKGKKGSGSPLDDDYYEHSPPLADLDAASGGGAESRGASPTPSDLRLRLARLIKKAPRPSFYEHGSRHSVDLPATSTARFATADGLLSISPPHPPFAAPAKSHSRDRQSGLTGKRKRASGVDGEDGEEGDEEREMSPSARKKANLIDVATPGRQETSAMVENTRKMLRELREFMDRVDQEEAVPLRT
ncbi:SAC3/GANP/Nin1/mts3/eIF-3 p25 family-domain-containing protein [Achaetomium macrosporum]|uniref:SAC3/GANP/Nin1/mts3/eIF-3 p25 family-domain-containing protein n=1 Tax=Achaetomium macrosporum TaxID=79813 RepID=A0AAN7H7B2_9PEZI|nr:SAC3/GANP/Nin1/mts3/eIF-3 p25 family-domain-containing protein [Achaetomium macrosporum]